MIMFSPVFKKLRNKEIIQEIEKVYLTTVKKIPVLFKIILHINNLKQNTAIFHNLNNISSNHSKLGFLQLNQTLNFIMM